MRPKNENRAWSGNHPFLILDQMIYFLKIEPSSAEAWGGNRIKSE